MSTKPSIVIVQKRTKHLDEMLYNTIEKFKCTLKPKRQENIVETAYFIRLIRRLVGASVITIQCTPDRRVVATFTWLGFVTFIIWYTSYFYCLFTIITEDQTILRSLYNTRLQRYGDDVETYIVSLFVLYAMWKIPFDLSGSTSDVQLIMEIDKAFLSLDEPVLYSNSVLLAAGLLLLQCVVTGTRVLSVWSALHMSADVPVEKVFQMVFSDAVIFIITAQYCSYLLVLRWRYRSLNKALNSIRQRTSSEFFKFRQHEQPVPNSISSAKDKYLCKKIKACGKIYAKLYAAAGLANGKYGLVLLVMMAISLLLTILHLYYFMEATASGLFHDNEKYLRFLTYDSWQIAFSVPVMLICIYFSERTVKEALEIPHVVHQIINSDLGSAVETAAMNLSIQILHQKPAFTAYGLFRLDYIMVLEGVRSVVTFLVILLQFVTDKRSK